MYWYYRKTKAYQETLIHNIRAMYKHKNTVIRKTFTNTEAFLADVGLRQGKEHQDDTLHVS